MTYRRESGKRLVENGPEGQLTLLLKLAPEVTVS
jgi:hypothetical protein